MKLEQKCHITFQRQMSWTYNMILNVLNFYGYEYEPMLNSLSLKKFENFSFKIKIETKHGHSI